MNLPEGRGLLPAVLACALCLVWGLGPAAAQETTGGGVYGGDLDKPARLGPKPKPLRSTYVEPAAPAAPPSGQATPAGQRAKSKKARKPPKASPAAGAASSGQPRGPKLVKEPKPKAKRVKAPKPVKQAVTAKPRPQPRAAAAVPVKVSTRAVQQALNRAGYPAPLDGKMNKRTRHALRNFQRAHGLPASGQADRPTLAKLGLL